MTRRILPYPLSLFLLALCTLPAMHAQSAPTAHAAQTSPAAALDSLATRFEHDFTRVATAMPVDKFDFRPSSTSLPGSNYAGVRSFSEEVKHVAWSNYATVSGITGQDPPTTRQAIDTLTRREDILAALAASFVAVHQAIATLTPQNENDTVEDVGVGGQQSRISLAAWISVHGYDHYGQLVEYLRMNGVVPPSGTATPPPQPK